ncbi:MAG: response regulator [Zoogloeaceae bacterium]|jgi:two-component system chemotaxis response regulator CheY|nr:response regulator [Zoogloeaceae bacterium]
MAHEHLFGGMSVLLVEPSVTQAQIVEGMLRDLGVERLGHCASGQDALREMRKSQPHVVISSLYLPDMDGTELVFSMRKDDDLEDVPFVLISSETRPQALEPIRQSGACYIMTKPFTGTQLRHTLFNIHDLLNPSDDWIDIEQAEKLRVLVVDDSFSSRRHLCRMLNELGIENVREAKNGKEALEYMAETMVDLVLTDYNMPEMDGRELTEYIRTQSWQSSVTILMITSEENKARLAAVEKAGVSSIYDKPFGVRDMQNIIAKVLE